MHKEGRTSCDPQGALLRTSESASPLHRSKFGVAPVPEMWYDIFVFHFTMINRFGLTVGEVAVPVNEGGYQLCHRQKSLRL